MTPPAGEITSLAPKSDSCCSTYAVSSSSSCGARNSSNTTDCARMISGRSTTLTCDRNPESSFAFICTRCGRIPCPGGCGTGAGGEPCGAMGDIPGDLGVEGACLGPPGGCGTGAGGPGDR